MRKNRSKISTKYISLYWAKCRGRCELSDMWRNRKSKRKEMFDVFVNWLGRVAWFWYGTPKSSWRMWDRPDEVLRIRLWYGNWPYRSTEILSFEFAYVLPEQTQDEWTVLKKNPTWILSHNSTHPKFLPLSKGRRLQKKDKKSTTSCALFYKNTLVPLSYRAYDVYTSFLSRTQTLRERW